MHDIAAEATSLIGSEPIPQRENIGLRNLANGLIAVVLVVTALRVTFPIAMPLAFAAVIIAAAWPIKPWLSRILPPWASYACTLLILIGVLAAFGAAIYFASAQAVQSLASNAARFDRVYGEFVGWAARYGVPLDQVGDRRIVAAAQTLLANAYTVMVYLGFIIVLVAFGLPEVAALRAKLRKELETSTRLKVLDSAEEIADKIRRYLGVTLATSLLTGIATAAWSYAIGVELALTWGVLNFLLNFIPVVGNIIGIVPPTLYALIQFGDPTMALVAFVGFAVIQLVISNFIYPLLQGHSLALSPIGIVVSLAFWSWLWGIGGALIAIPLTAALVIVCDHFDNTRWLSKILSR